MAAFAPHEVPSRADRHGLQPVEGRGALGLVAYEPDPGEGAGVLDAGVGGADGATDGAKQPLVVLREQRVLVSV